MIDWVGLAFGALWVFGLALALTTVSVAGWVARERGLRLRRLLAARDYIVPIEVGGALFAVGLAYGGLPWWQTGLWLLVAAAFAYDAIATYRRGR
ncbi:MAG: hypothetical protein ACYC5O_24585 [Anaerolineae bacterium]